MSLQAQRTCVFKRCPDTEYVPRKSDFTPTDIYALDLNEWIDIAALEHAVLKSMCYLESGIQDIGYHLMGEGCGMQRPLEELFTDPVQHASQRRNKGVLLHLKLKGKEAAISSQEGMETQENTAPKVTLELAFYEGEQFDTNTNTWKCVAPYAWDSGSSSSRIKVDANMLVAGLPGLFRLEILERASQNQTFTTHYLRDNGSNIMFTSAVTSNGLLVSMDDGTPDRSTVSDLGHGDNDKILHAAVVMTKIKIGAPTTPDMMLDAVRPVLPDNKTLRPMLGTSCELQEKKVPGLGKKGVIDESISMIE